MEYTDTKHTQHAAKIKSIGLIKNRRTINKKNIY